MTVDCIANRVGNAYHLRRGLVAASDESASRLCSNLAHDSTANRLVEEEPVSPTQLLTLAIRKRRELFDEKDPGLCRELLNKSLIQHLCRQLGEARNSSRRRSSSRRHRSRSASSKRRHSGADSRDMKRRRLRLLDEDENALYIDDEEEEESNGGYGQGSSPNAAEFEVGAMVTASGERPPLSMVQAAEPQLDYDQMERLLDAGGDQFDGYIGHWSEERVTSPGTASDQKTDPTSQSNLSLTPLQPPNNGAPIDESRPSPELDPDDPFDMKSLFQRSYSIIEPSQDDDDERGGEEEIGPAFLFTWSAMNESACDELGLMAAEEPWNAVGAPLCAY